TCALPISTSRLDRRHGRALRRRSRCGRAVGGGTQQRAPQARRRRSTPMRWAREVGCYQEDIRFGSLREVVDGELQCNDLGRLYGLRTTFKQSSCLFKNISKPWGASSSGSR